MVRGRLRGWLGLLSCHSFSPRIYLVADLNLPIADGLCERFDIIIDSGTIEHIFDTRAVLMNIGRMLRPG